MWLLATVLDKLENGLVNFQGGLPPGRANLERFPGAEERDSLLSRRSEDELCLFPGFLQGSSARSVLVSAAPPAQNMLKSSFPGKILILLFLFNFF